VNLRRANYTYAVCSWKKAFDQESCWACVSVAYAPEIRRGRRHDPDRHPIASRASIAQGGARANPAPRRQPRTARRCGAWRVFAGRAAREVSNCAANAS